jgi:hypothetical protein
MSHFQVFFDPRQAESSRGSTRTIESAYPFGAGIIEKGETIPADARGGWLRHIERCRGRYGCVGSISSFGKNFQSGGHGQGLRSCHHASPTHDRRTTILVHLGFR